MKFIRPIDIFGTQVGFLVNNDQRYKTTIGAFGTITFLILILLLIISSLDSIFKKQNVVVQQRKQIEQQSDVIIVDNTNLMFAIKVISRVSDSPVSIGAKMIDITNRNATAVEHEFTMVNCNTTHFSQLQFSSDTFIQEVQNLANLSTWYCPSSNFSFTLFRSVDIKESLSTQLQFYSQQQLQAPIVEFLVAYLEIQEYNQEPLVGHVFSEMFPLNTKLGQSVLGEINFKKWVVLTDESIYPNEDWVERNYFLTSLEDSRYQIMEMMYDKNAQIQNFLTLNIKASRQTITSTRQYEKIQKAISFLGGFFQVMRIFFTIIFSTYNSFDLWLKLSRQFFVMHVHESVLQEENLNKQRKIQKNQTMARRKAGNVFAFNAAVVASEGLFDPLDDEDVPQTRKKAINKATLSLQEFQAKLTHILEASKVLVPKFRYYLAAAICRFSRDFAKNRIVFQMAISIIHEDLDIFRYVQALSDIEKLKRLLLNEEQRQLFDFKQKQDVIVKKNSSGILYAEKGFNIQNKSDVKNNNHKIFEPNAMDPIHIQLSMYEEVWKILIKLRNQQVKQDTLMYKINNGLIQFLRNDIKELFEQMLDQNDRTSLVQRYKQMRGSTDLKISENMRNSRMPIPRVSNLPTINENKQNHPNELSPSMIFDPMELFNPMKTARYPVINKDLKHQLEIELQQHFPLRQIEGDDDSKYLTRTESTTYISDNKIIQQVSQSLHIDIRQLFTDDIDLVLLPCLLTVSVKYFVEWVEDQDNPPFGMLTCYLRLQNRSTGRFENCVFGFDTSNLMKMQQEEIMNLQQIHQFQELYRVPEVKQGSSIEVALVYQILSLEHLLHDRDLMDLTLEDFLGMTNQQILISYTMRAKHYKVNVRINNSFLRNWKTQRPNTDVLLNDSSLFSEETYFNLGHQEMKQFTQLKNLIDREDIIDKNTLIGEVKEYNSNSSDFDLEKHYEELTTQENVMFLFVLRTKLVEMLARQSHRRAEVLTRLQQEDNCELLKREYSSIVEMQYFKDQTTSLFYLSTQTIADDGNEQMEYYRERQALIQISHLAFQHYYKLQ